MKRAALSDETGGSTIMTVLVVALIAVFLGVVAYQAKGANKVDTGLNAMVLSCNVAAGFDNGKAQYCTITTNNLVEIDGRSRYVDCSYLAGKNLLDSPTPLFTTCPSDPNREKNFCQSLADQKKLSRDTFVNDKPCVSEGRTNSWLGQTYAEATTKTA